MTWRFNNNLEFAYLLRTEATKGHEIKAEIPQPHTYYKIHRYKKDQMGFFGMAYEG